LCPCRRFPPRPLLQPQMQIRMPASALAVADAEKKEEEKKEEKKKEEEEKHEVGCACVAAGQLPVWRQMVLQKSWGKAAVFLRELTLLGCGWCLARSCLIHSRLPADLLLLPSATPRRSSKRRQLWLPRSMLTCWFPGGSRSSSSSSSRQEGACSSVWTPAEPPLQHSLGRG